MKRILLCLITFFLPLLASEGDASLKVVRPATSIVYRFLPYEDLQKKRTRETKGDLERSAPLIVGGRLYCGTQWGYLAALDLKTFSEKWVTPLEGSLLSAPAYDQGTLYVGTRGGTLSALKEDTGEILWEFSTTSPILSSPLVSEGKVYFLTGNDILYALDQKTGKRAWHWHRMINQPISIFSSSTPVAYKNFIIAGLADGYVIALNKEDGSLIWQADLHAGAGRRFRDIDATPILHNGILYVPSYSGALYSIDPDNGEIQWFAGEGGNSGAAVSGNFLYYGGTNGTLYAVNASSGVVLKKVSLDSGVVGTPVIVDKTLYIPTSEGRIFALDRDTFEELWRVDVGKASGFLGELLLHEGYLYAVSVFSNLYKISAASWKVTLPPAAKRKRLHPVRHVF
ncbi:MAG: PQQ-binding-like beta-propeller repeat protein [Deltaproteobacteria bacterium]|nr:PQQ-binding-like beta-propeller repeat protein [Deltaproteobacteria bacterium]